MPKGRKEIATFAHPFGRTSAILCTAGLGLARCSVCKPLNRKRNLKIIPTRLWQHSCSYYGISLPRSVPRCPEWNSHSGFCNRLTESVPSGTLLLQSVGNSID
jgi:hypothetical protein